MIINIINVILINHKTNTCEISGSKFFEIVSLFLRNLSINTTEKKEKELFSTKIMYSFLDLCSYLLNNFDKFQTQCESYLNNLLLNIKIMTKFSLSNQNIIFDFIAKHINSINSENIIDYENLFAIMGYYNEFYQSYFCCEEHQAFFGEK